MWSGGPLCQGLRQDPDRETNYPNAKDWVSEGDTKMVQLNGQCLLAVNPTSAYHVTGYLNDIQVNFMLDTRAPVSLVQKDVFDQARGELVPWAGGGLVGVEVTPLVVHGMATVEIGLLGKVLPSEVVVASSQAILGVDFLERNRCVINTPKRILHLHGLAIPVQTMPSPDVVQASVLLQGTLRIPALSGMEVMVDTSQPLKDGTWLLEGMSDKGLPFLVARTMGNPVVGGGTTCMLARLMNPTLGEITIHKGTRVDRVELIDKEAVANLASHDRVVTPDHEGPNDSHVSGKKAADVVEHCRGNRG